MTDLTYITILAESTTSIIPAVNYCLFWIAVNAIGYIALGINFSNAKTRRAIKFEAQDSAYYEDMVVDSLTAEEIHAIRNTDMPAEQIRQAEDILAAIAEYEASKWELTNMRERIWAADHVDDEQMERIHAMHEDMLDEEFAMAALNMDALIDALDLGEFVPVGERGYKWFAKNDELDADNEEEEETVYDVTVYDYQHMPPMPSGYGAELANNVRFL